MAQTVELIRSREIESEAITPLERLQERREAGYRPGIDNDGHKIGLAMDAGGYAGVVGLSEAEELNRQGLLDYIDSIYGLSVGTINALYTATRQFEDGRYVYTELMPGNFTKRFSPKVNLGALEEAVYHDRPLQLDKLPSNIPVVIGITRLEKFAPIMMRSNEMSSEEFLKWCLRACHLPYFADGPTPAEDGNHYSDSTLSWLSPIELAIKDGCTDVVSLSNSRPSQSTASKRAFFIGIGKAGDAFVGKYDPEADVKNILDAASGQGNYERLVRYKEEAANHFRGTLWEEGETVIERIYPENIGKLPGLLTMERKRLITGIDAGRLAVLRTLGLTQEFERVAA